MASMGLAKTITAARDHVIEADPARLSLVGPSASLRYEEVDAAAEAAAAAFREMGVSPGDGVAASLANDVDIVVSFHGAMRLGAVWVGVNRALAAAEKESLLDAATPTIFLADPDNAAAHEARWRVGPVDPANPQSDRPPAPAAPAGAARLAPPGPDAPAPLS